MRRLTCLAALVCCCSAPLPARADTITITGGALTAVGTFGFTSFTLTGEGFEVVGGREPGFAGPASCFPCVAGDPVNFDGQFSGGFTLGSGPATVDGVSYAKLWYTGVLAFDGETMAFPEASSSLDLTSPFALVSDPGNRSFLQGYLTNPFDNSDPPVFRADVVGGGLATATFSEGIEQGQFFFRQVNYAFLAPEPVPEPTSFLLLGIGLIGVGVRHWRRRKA
jgi:hypothetical protein